MLRSGVQRIVPIAACALLSSGLAAADELQLTPAVLACALRVYETGLLVGESGGEAGTVLYAGDDGELRCHAITRTISGGAVALKIRTGAVAILHTHPPKTQEWPSEHDGALAKRLGIPVYTLQRLGIWRVDPAGVLIREAGREWTRTASKARKALAQSE
jgi:hypothetical protein